MKSKLNIKPGSIFLQWERNQSCARNRQFSGKPISERNQLQKQKFHVVHASDLQLYQKLILYHKKNCAVLFEWFIRFPEFADFTEFDERPVPFRKNSIAWRRCSRDVTRMHCQDILSFLKHPLRQIYFKLNYKRCPGDVTFFNKVMDVFAERNLFPKIAHV